MPRKTSAPDTPASPFSARSLRPDHQLIVDAVINQDAAAWAIVEAWKFSFPITHVEPDDPRLERIGEVVFHA